MALTDGLILVIHANEGTGTTAADSSGQGNHGTLTGATWDSVNQKLGASCISFDGADDKVEIANESNFDFERTQAFSIQVWLKKDVVDVAKRIFQKLQDYTSYRGIVLDAGVDNRFYFFLINDYPSVNRIQLRTTDPFTSITNWYHLIVTYDGSSTAAGVKFYVDNILQTNFVNNDSLSATILNNASVVIGGSQTYFFDGLKDEVAVWNRVITSTEVAELWNGGAGIEITAAGQPFNLRGLNIPGLRQWQPNMVRR